MQRPDTPSSKLTAEGPTLALATTIPTEDPAEMGERFRRLEEIGYDVGFSFESRHDPFLPLALASATTERIGLGTAVAIGFARNPMVLASVAWDLQRMTAGRFRLGLGSQVRPHIERRFSEPWHRPAERMGELVRAIRSIWTSWQTGDPLDFRGDHYTHTIMIPAFDPGPLEWAPPPILVGGVGPKMVETAGRDADGLIVHPFHTPESLAGATWPALDRGLVAAGRSRSSFEVVAVTMCAPWTDDESEAATRASLAEQLAFYGSTPAYAPTLAAAGLEDLHPELNRLSKEGRWAEMPALIPDELCDAVAVMGPRDQVAGRLVDRIRAMGSSVDTISLVNNRNPDPDDFADVVTEVRAALAST